VIASLECRERACGERRTGKTMPRGIGDTPTCQMAPNSATRSQAAFPGSYSRAALRRSRGKAAQNAVEGVCGQICKASYGLVLSGWRLGLVSLVLLLCIAPQKAS